jgi:hypothetical protein
LRQCEERYNDWTKLDERGSATFQSRQGQSRSKLGGLYLRASVGVGEHPDLVQEIIELIKTITEADEAIKYLENKCR